MFLLTYIYQTSIRLSLPTVVEDEGVPGNLSTQFRTSDPNNPISLVLRPSCKI